MYLSFLSYLYDLLIYCDVCGVSEEEDGTLGGVGKARQWMNEYRAGRFFQGGGGLLNAFCVCGMK